jgi:aminoglycoside 3-N-acetyltransferase
VTGETHSIEQVRAQLEALGVQRGDVLVVHTSFRAVRPVENGPLGLIAALRGALGTQGTLVMPAMTDGASVFDPARTPTLDMGITAELFWREPDVLRSTHPGASFAAAGPLAERICAPQPLEPPHGHDSPIGRVYDAGGKVLLLGVSHSENTAVHLAEALAGVPYSIAHDTVVEVDGVARVVPIAESDSCCEGFKRVGEWLRERGAQREGRVGNAHAVLCAATDVVSAALERLRVDPLIFLCAPDAGCEDCALARASFDAR